MSPNVESDFHASLGYFERYGGALNEKTFYAQQSSCRNPLTLLCERNCNCFASFRLSPCSQRVIYHIRVFATVAASGLRRGSAEGGIKHKTL